MTGSPEASSGDVAAVLTAFRRALAREIDCPTQGCTARLRVNPFVVRRVPIGRSPRRWWFGRRRAWRTGHHARPTRIASPAATSRREPKRRHVLEWRETALGRFQGGHDQLHCHPCVPVRPAMAEYASPPGWLPRLRVCADWNLSGS